MADLKFAHFIPHVNRIDLTRIAVKSTVGTVAADHVVILDNSPTKEIYRQCDDIWEMVLFPTVPLTTAQTMNWMKAIAREWQLDYFGFQHNDAEPAEHTIDRLYELAETLQEPWGVIFSNYDTCCVFNAKAVEATGDWDWLRFPFYHLDNDYYHRLRLAGYPTIRTDLKCHHHNDASNTIKADPERALVNSAYFPVSAKLLTDKWGCHVE